MFRRALTLALSAVLLGWAPPVEAGSARSRSETARLAPQRPGVTDAYILSFGLWGPQSVFESEARGAARVLEAALDGQGRSIVRFNGKRRFGARPEALFAAARAAGAALDPDEDVVVLMLT